MITFIKKASVHLMTGMTVMQMLFTACTTDDVKAPIAGTGKLVEITDAALGEYLVYNSQRTDDERLPAGTAVKTDGKFYLDTDKAANATNLYLVKNETQIKKLAAAGLSTADVKISDIDILPYFTSLKTLKLTSNSVRRIDITSCTEIETIEMNNNLVSSIDLSRATKLVRFRYGSASDTPDDNRLSSIDLSNCTSLQHLYLKNQNIGADALTLPSNYSNLTEIDLSGNPGAPFPVPSALYNQLTTKLGVSEGGSGTPDTPGDGFTIPDDAFGEYLGYLSDNGDLPDGIVTRTDSKYILNKAIAATVTVLNVAKTAKIIATLKDAGVVTAETAITSADGLQFFTSLKEFTATSNNFTSPLTLTALKDLEVLQVNTAGVSELDVSANTKLRVLNCNGSSKYARLKAVNLSANVMLETLNLKNNEIESIDLSTLTRLREVDLSGNPGADFPIPSGIYNNLTSHKGVKEEAPQTATTHILTDPAFGEYLVYLSRQGALPEGIVETDGTKYLLDIKKAATVTALNVAKTAKTIETLKAAGLTTAAVPISSADGLQFFTSLQEFTATSNNFTSPLPLTALKDLEVLQVNTAGVSELDVSANTKLRVLNCNGSSKYARLKAVNLSANVMLETLNLKNNEIESIDLSTLTRLKEVDLSGNPGADFPIPSGIYNNLTSHKGVKPSN